MTKTKNGRNRLLELIEQTLQHNTPDVAIVRHFIEGKTVSPERVASFLANCKIDPNSPADLKLDEDSLRITPQESFVLNSKKKKNPKKVRAFCLDFDETLTSEDTVNGFLKWVEPSSDPEVKQARVAKFRENLLSYHKAGYDHDFAFIRAVLDYNKSVPFNERFTKQNLEEFGSSQVQYYKGVEDLFENLRAEQQKIDPSVEVQFHLISGGFGDLVRASKLGKKFDTITASEFVYDDKGEIVDAKNVVNFTTKVTALKNIHAGATDLALTDPYISNQRVDPKNAVAHYRNMVYIDDGGNGAAAFDYLRGQGGLAMGVFNAQNANQQTPSKLLQGNYVDFLAGADYSPNGAAFKLMATMLQAWDAQSREKGSPAPELRGRRRPTFNVSANANVGYEADNRSSRPEKRFIT